MNKKLIKASVAGAAAIALAAGGTTFASWSDFGITGTQNVGADRLVLDVNPNASSNFDNVTLAPGSTRDYAFYVASRSSGTTITGANLTMTLADLVGAEDGCTSNSESMAESNIANKSDASATCNTNLGSNEGQFAQQTLYYVQAKKTDNPESCTNDSMQDRQRNTQLSQMEDVPVNLLAAGDTLAPGEGVCVDVELFMPNDEGQYGLVANDASQGDQASFKIRFDLTQATVS